MRKMKYAFILLMVALIGVSTISHASENWTGDGGKEMSITILAPKATGLEENQSHLPALVQGEFVSNFSSYSAISVLDWERLDKIYSHLLSDEYSDDERERVDLGNLTHTTHIMDGKITKTATGYHLQMNIIKTNDKITAASYSKTFTFAELDDLTGIRQTSLELLQKMGVTLTAKAQEELAGAATANHVSAQTALARGVTAQRQGTEVAALSYYYQAAAFDPSLLEATKRSSVMVANISSASIGDNIRNDIEWRRQWVERITETEKAFHEMINTAAPPYSLFYSTGIETGNINYQKETANLSIPINLTANGEWFAAMNRALQAVQAVLNGLNTTGRKSDWGLAGWPNQGVSNANPFASWKQYDIAVAFELVNEQGMVIGRQTVRLNPSFSINNRFAIDFTPNTSSTLTFNAVKADDISDNLTIRIATINGAPPQTARFPITAISREERQQNILLRIENGVVLGFADRKAQSAWHWSPSASIGLTHMLNSVDSLLNGIFLISGNIECFKPSIDFIRFGLNIDLGVTFHNADAIKEMYPNIADSSINVIGFFKGGAFARLYPANALYLSGGANFGYYPGYNILHNGVRITGPATSTVVFPVGAGLILGPKDTGLLLDAQYNIVMLKDGIGGYWSFNVGGKLGRKRMN